MAVSGFVHAPELYGEEPIGPKLGAFAATLVGMWYSLTFASAGSIGAKFVSGGNPDSHYFLDSLAWLVGTALGAALACILARSRRWLVAILSTLPSAGIFVVAAVLLGHEKMEPLLFGYEPPVILYCSIFALLSVLAGPFVQVSLFNASPDDELIQQLRTIRPRHWLWLWIAAWAWVSMIPVVIYYLWLQIVTVLYTSVHPKLWFDMHWEGDVFLGLMPGFVGIAALIYGIELSLGAISKSGATRPEYSVRQKVLRFLGGTVLLVSIVSGFLLNWGISNLKNMPVAQGTNQWWIL